jgi:hypothetical protein
LHRTIRKLLPDAAGESEWVVAVNVDIRGFSSHMSANPSETALYLKKVYARMLDRFFADHSFFKPTGDGLLVVIPFQEADLQVVANSVVGDCLTLVEEFPTLISDEPLVTFPHPDRIGAGVSVGSVARLVTRRTTLDYTGRPLNVATRLMDLARPSGVVVDAALPISDTELKSHFVPDQVYLKGVAEQTPLDIVFTQNLSEIPDSYRKPITPDEWVVEEETLTVAAARKREGKFRTVLKHEPTNRYRIGVRVIYPDYKNGRRIEGIERQWDLDSNRFSYSLEGGKRAVVEVNYTAIVQRFSTLKMPGRTNFRIEIGYPARSAPTQPTPNPTIAALIEAFAKK